MLNGKFFTGLPPKMMDRVGAGKNRQESQLFWPDESQTVSATDSRQKRKSSLQCEQQQEKPTLQRQSSIGQHDVDTKGMFHKEFAKSSIQFYDNIEEHPEPRRSTILKGKLARQEIAPKPTATRLELPKTIIDEDYTNAKKQQTYASKIEFYDYADEGPLNNKPRMDMNDKRAVERNTKNSPKLQNKNNVQNLRVDPVVPAPQMKFRNDYGRDARIPVKDGNTRKLQPIEREHVPDEVDHENNRRSTPSRKHEELVNNTTQINRVEQQQVEQFDHYEPDTYDYSRKPDASELHYIENSMRNVKIQPTLRKHVTYQDDYESVGFNEQYYEKPSSSRARMPNPMNAGSHQRQQTQRRLNTSNYGTAETQYRENRQRSARSTFNNYNNALDQPHNNNSANHNIHNNNNSNIQDQRKMLPKMSTQPPTPFTPTMDLMEPSLEAATTTDSQQNLRSDIFFMEPPSSPSTSTTATTTPTLNYRRNARSSATQRVSVGLPD